MWKGLINLKTLRLTGNKLVIELRGFCNLPSIKLIIIDLPTFKTQNDMILSPVNILWYGTYPPKAAHRLGAGWLACDSSNCWLKRLENKHHHTNHYIKDGKTIRLKCKNMTIYWDEAELNRTGTFNEQWNSKKSPNNSWEILIVLYKIPLVLTFHLRETFKLFRQRRQNFVGSVVGGFVIVTFLCALTEYRCLVHFRMHTFLVVLIIN